MIAFLSFSQSKINTYNSIVSDSIINSFVQDIIRHSESFRFGRIKNLQRKIVNLNEVDWSYEALMTDNNHEEEAELLIDRLSQYDTIFNQQDFDFIKNQLIKPTNSEWNKSTFPKILSNSKKAYEFSIPYFSKDLMIAIFWISKYRSPQNSWGNLSIYQYKDGKWELLIYIDGFIS